MACLRIDKSLLKLKVVFTLFFLGSGVITPFLSIFLKNLGLHASEAGIIGGVLPILVFPIRPVIGALSERLDARKTVLVVTFFIFLATRICFLQVPPNHHQTVSIANLNVSTLQTVLEPCAIENVTITDCSEVCSTQTTDGSNYISAPNQLLYCKAFKDEKEASQFGTNAESCPVMKSSDRADIIVFEPRSSSRLTWGNVTDLRQLIEIFRCAKYESEGLVYQLNTTQLESFDGRPCRSYTSLVCSDVGFDTQKELASSTFGLTFWLCFVLFFLSTLTEFLLISGIDAIAYGQLDGTRSSYGYQRVFGSIGYAVAALPAAFLLDVSSEGGSDIDFSIPVYAGSAILLLTAIIVGTLKIPSLKRVKEVHKACCKIMMSADVLIFFIICGFLGACHLTMEMFLFWYLKELGSNQLVMGLAVATRTLGELISLVLSGVIIKRIGQIKALYLSILANTVRLGAYSFLTNPWYVLLIEPLHGLTFSLMWAATTYHATTIAPPEILFTFQSLLAGVIVSVGGGSGVLLSGYLFDAVGPVWTFRYYSIAAGVALVVYCSLHTFVFSREQRRRFSSENEEKEGEVDTAVPLKNIKDIEDFNDG